MIGTNNTLQLLSSIAVLFPVFLLVFTFRGFIQALVANLMGDSTAKDEGFLTLNPLIHVEIFGLTFMIILFFVFGSLLGESMSHLMDILLLIILCIRSIYPLPIKENNFKYLILCNIITRLSGIFCNILLALIVAFFMKILLTVKIPNYALVSLLEILKTTLEVSILFGILNTLPLPSFDGGKLLNFLLPQSQQHIVSWLEKYELFILFGIFIIPGVSNFFFYHISFIAAIIKANIYTIVF